MSTHQLGASAKKNSVWSYLVFLAAVFILVINRNVLAPSTEVFCSQIPYLPLLSWVLLGVAAISGANASIQLTKRLKNPWQIPQKVVSISFFIFIFSISGVITCAPY